MHCLWNAYSVLMLFNVAHSFSLHRACLPPPDSLLKVRLIVVGVVVSCCVTFSLRVLCAVTHRSLSLWSLVELVNGEGILQNLGL